MRWGGGRTGGNIEDRRGLGPVGVAGGGIGAALLALAGYFFFGIDPQTTMNAANQLTPQAQQEGTRGTPQDEAGRFVDVVEKSAQDVWTPLFAAQGQTYTRPSSIVLYEQNTSTGCGLGQSAMGPFYCPRDQKVYLDLSFWQELESQFGARGEFARAYVIAHEIGHHIQNLTGSMERAGGKGAESGSVRLELQADCYAGVWAARAPETSGGEIGIDPADIQSGLSAASAVGDDTIQKRTQGQVVPDAFTHGSAEQRMRWFKRGYERGDPAACDTFSAARL
ncbi:MAG: neutral zinc metallopeptidase [Caulobacter sp.]